MCCAIIQIRKFINKIILRNEIIVKSLNIDVFVKFKDFDVNTKKRHFVQKARFAQKLLKSA